MARSTVIILMVQTLLVSLACCKSFHSWKHCYGENASGVLFTRDAWGELRTTVHDTIGLNFNIIADVIPEEGLSGGTYKISFWHEETGATMKYKGPFDICTSGFVVPSKAANCTAESPCSDCPIVRSLQASVLKPLHVEEAGKYEAELSILSETGEELLCTIIAFKMTADDFNRENSTESTSQIEDAQPLLLPG